MLVSILPLVLAAGLVLFFGFGFLKNDLNVLNVCRAKQLEIQNKVGKNLGRLLKLNPRALKLRLAQIKAERALAVAIQSGQPAAVAAAEAYLLKVQMQRQALDLKQQALIQTANTWLAFGGTDLPQRMLTEWHQQSSPVSSWLQASLRLASPQIPRLAVQKDFPEVAPVYELVPRFEEAQAWDQAWTLEFKTLSWPQKFLNFNGRFQRSCMTSLYHDAEHDADSELWVAKLKKDKSSLKASF